jgi:hypothetical protein
LSQYWIKSRLVISIRFGHKEHCTYINNIKCYHTYNSGLNQKII